MDFLTSPATLPLLFGCVGIFSLLKLLQRMRMRAYLQNAVVVITGATSGLGRGGSLRQCCWGWGCGPGWRSRSAAQGLPGWVT